MKTRNFLLLVIGLILCGTIALLLHKAASKSSAQDAVFESISQASIAKFEYCNESMGGYKVLHSDTYIISRMIGSLSIEPVDGEFDEEWIYRITFHVAVNVEDIVVLVGKSSMSICDVVYVSKGETPFSSILEAFAVKYHTLGGSLQYS